MWNITIPCHLFQDLVNDTLLVNENEISQAIRYVFETQKMILEGRPAVGTEALLAKMLEIQKLNVALIYSGNIIADNTLQKVLDS